jgi:hypothetical protein
MKEKEMLSLRRDDSGKFYARINYSSLDVLQTCMRKADYSFNRKLRTENKSAALIFGTAFHKAMEVWYASGQENRKHISDTCIEYQHVIVGSICNGRPIPIGHGQCSRCSAVSAFIQSAHDNQLSESNNPGPRTIDKGTEIINAFCTERLDEGLSVYSDANGPCIERNFEVELFDSPELHVTYFGTIDLILKDAKGRLYVTDHKTTRSFGVDFFNRIRPNFQYIGYVMGARTALCLDVSDFLVNGAQVTKTMAPAFVRQPITVSQSDIQELLDAVRHNLRNWVVCNSEELYPMSCPNACTMWGGCHYHDICSEPAELREDVIKGIQQTADADKKEDSNAKLN